ncbi:MAG: di-trans,poly-cis-decaprenylcistransferase [Acidobacteria bacterium]|nr:di-trans,poly-cis-decaprenylcistransferase [Acidobacteriota bacterium]
MLDDASLAWRALKAIVKRPFYAVYERRLAKRLHEWELPRHIGIIMDGNRRFARDFGRRRVLYGHSRGAEKLREVLRWCQECNIPVVTVWSFSLDNFQRNDAEVDDLLQLFEDRTRELIDSPDVHENGIRVRYIGKTDLLPESLQQAIDEVEHTTRDYDDFHLNIAMAYGGRQEITDAFRQYLVDRNEEGASLADVAEEIDDSCIERYLYTKGQPEPDLILRTSGEIRMSGFLLWQSAYSEYYFCDTYWPAFRRIDLFRALRAYSQRQRRLGR